MMIPIVNKTLAKRWGNQILKKSTPLIYSQLSAQVNMFSYIFTISSILYLKKFMLTAAHMKSVQYQSCSFCFPIVFYVWESLSAFKNVCLLKRLKLIFNTYFQPIVEYLFGRTVDNRQRRSSVRRNGRSHLHQV